LGTFTLSFTVGATITGWIFITHDPAGRSRSGDG
jgi:hypothetical protein